MSPGGQFLVSPDMSSGIRMAFALGSDEYTVIADQQERQLHPQ
jgi:hypothetical protein